MSLVDNFCARNARVGLLGDAGKCRTVPKSDGGVKKFTQDDGFQILVDHSEAEITELEAQIEAEIAANEALEDEVASATDGMISVADADAQIEAAVASATDGMYTQAEDDAAIEMACHLLPTQMRRLRPPWQASP